MEYRRFGKTELAMPVLTCGGMRFQHKWSDEPLAAVPADNQTNLERVVARAFELGINHFETARGYGTSEVQLGQVLPGLPRAKIIVQTKVGPTADPDEFRATCERSLSLLRLDHVDLLSIHGVNDGETLDQTIRPGGCLEMAHRLRDEGLARHIGFSTHAPAPIILRAIASGGFAYVNLHWYFVNDLTWPAVVEAHRRDMGVFIISPNDKGGKLYGPPPRMIELCRPLTPMQFNDLYCLARPEVHTLSIGAAGPGDFDEHVAALAHYADAAAAVAPIEARLRQRMDEALGADWWQHWPDGLPEYTEAPGNINLREILRLWSFAKALDLVDWAKMRYNLLGNGGNWFPGTKAAAFDRAAVAAAVRGNPFAARIPDILAEAHAMLAGEQKKRLSESG